MSLLMCEQEGGTEEVGWCTQKVQAAYAAMGLAVERPRSVGTACQGQFGPIVVVCHQWTWNNPSHLVWSPFPCFHFVATLGGHSKSLD